MAAPEPSAGPTGHEQTISRLANPAPLILVLGLGIFVGGFDQTFIVTVLPDIIDDFDLPVNRFALIAWVINGYLLGYIVAMPVMGRLADMFGRVRVYLISLAIFMAGSVGVALSPNLWWMVVFRGFSALGGGALIPIAMAIAADTLRQERRPLAVGSLSALDDASSLMGPLWGAIIATLWGWRWLFWLNIILALPVMLAVPLLAKDRKGPGALPRPKFDLPGALLLSGGLTLFSIGLTDTNEDPRPLWLTLSLLSAGLAAGIGFVVRELRVPEPLIDLRPFRRAPVIAANITYFLTGAALITVMINVPLLTNVLWGGDSLDGGLNLMRMMLFMPIGGVVGGLLAIRLGYRTTAIVGFVGAAIALVIMRGWSDSPSSLALWIPLALAGLCFTLDDAPIIATVLDHAHHTQRAAATALLQVVQTIGMMVGTALLATQGLGRFTERADEIFREQQLQGGARPYQLAVKETFSEMFVVAALAMVAAAVLGLFLAGGRARRFRWATFFGIRGRPDAPD